MARGGTESAVGEVQRPRQHRIPGTEDARIDALEDAVQDYAAICDKILLLGTSKRKVKVTILQLMKDNEKEVYRRDGIEIKVIPEEERIRVRVGKTKLMKELFDEN